MNKYIAAWIQSYINPPARLGLASVYESYPPDDAASINTINSGYLTRHNTKLSTSADESARIPYRHHKRTAPSETLQWLPPVSLPRDGIDRRRLSFLCVFQLGHRGGSDRRRSPHAKNWKSIFSCILIKMLLFNQLCGCLFKFTL